MCSFVVLCPFRVQTVEGLGAVRRRDEGPTSDRKPKRSQEEEEEEEKKKDWQSSEFGKRIK